MTGKKRYKNRIIYIYCLICKRLNQFPIIFSYVGTNEQAQKAVLHVQKWSKAGKTELSWYNCICHKLKMLMHFCFSVLASLCGLIIPLSLDNHPSTPKVCAVIGKRSLSIDHSVFSTEEPHESKSATTLESFSFLNGIGISNTILMGVHIMDIYTSAWANCYSCS